MLRHRVKRYPEIAMNVQVRGGKGEVTTSVYNLPLGASRGFPRGSTFPPQVRDDSYVDKSEHGRLLKAAMGRKAVARKTVADATNVKPRTVTNWTSGTTMPSEAEREALRVMFGPYDIGGDPVEAAVKGSELHEWRQDDVITQYKRHLHEQALEERRSS